MARKDWYNPNNILGWSREEYIDFICEQVNLKIKNFLPLTPFENAIYLNHNTEWKKRRNEKD